jgi:hypothetical protein
VRAEQTDAELTIDDVLPLVRIGMPMQLAQAARLEVENNARDCLRYGEAIGADPPFAAEFVNRVRLLGQ